MDLVPDGQTNKFLQRKRSSLERLLDKGFQRTAAIMAAMVGLVLLSIFLIVFTGALESIRNYGLKFLVISEWNPVTNEYGAFTAIYGTLVTSLSSIIIAMPLSVGTAILLTEDILPNKIREIIGLMIELLAAIPSVVLGLWAIFVMEPFLRPFLTGLNTNLGWIPFLSTEPIGPGMAPAIIILVIMILPIITSISRDSLNQVPKKLREAAYGIGATRWSAIFNILLPAAISGITGGALLALGRALGETMAVTMIIGNSLSFNWSLLAPGNTISAMLANQFGEADGIQVSSLMYAAFILMLISLVVNIIAQWIVKRLSLKY